MSSDGKGIPALLDFFLRKDRKRFFLAFVDAAIAHIPGLTDIQIATPQPNLRRVDLVVDHDFVISADQSSVGVRLMLFFLALAYHPEPPELILIEEPERGVHPSRLSDIIQLFRGLTEGAQTPGASQVILTTHSPYLLDLIDIDRDGVLIFQREEDGSRTVHPADADRLKVFLDEFHLGEVWYNEGEAGMIRPAQKSVRNRPGYRPSRQVAADLSGTFWMRRDYAALTAADRRKKRPTRLRCQRFWKPRRSRGALGFRQPSIWGNVRVGPGTGGPAYPPQQTKFGVCSTPWERRTASSGPAPKGLNIPDRGEAPVAEVLALPFTSAHTMAQPLRSKPVHLPRFTASPRMEYPAIIGPRPAQRHPDVPRAHRSARPVSGAALPQTVRRKP